jgi:hypothetical protein
VPADFQPKRTVSRLALVLPARLCHFIAHALPGSQSFHNYADDTIAGAEFDAGSSRLLWLKLISTADRLLHRVALNEMEMAAFKMLISGSRPSSQAVSLIKRNRSLSHT